MNEKIINALYPLIASDLEDEGFDIGAMHREYEVPVGKRDFVVEADISSEGRRATCYTDSSVVSYRFRLAIDLTISEWSEEGDRIDADDIDVVEIENEIVNLLYSEYHV